MADLYASVCPAGVYERRGRRARRQRAELRRLQGDRRRRARGGRRARAGAGRGTSGCSGVASRDVRASAANPTADALRRLDAQDAPSRPGSERVPTTRCAFRGVGPGCKRLIPSRSPEPPTGRSTCPMSSLTALSRGLARRPRASDLRALAHPGVVRYRCAPSGALVSVGSRGCRFGCLARRRGARLLGCVAEGTGNAMHDASAARHARVLPEPAVREPTRRDLPQRGRGGPASAPVRRASGLTGAHLGSRVSLGIDTMLPNVDMAGVGPRASPA